VRLHAEAALLLAGDDRVVVIPEQRLDPLYLAGEPLGVAADGRLRQLARVAGPLGRLARLM